MNKKLHLFLLSGWLFAALFPAVAQVRYVDAAELTLIGKALPTEQRYHRVDTTVYKGFTREENQQLRCSAGLALLFRTNSTRIETLPEYAFSSTGSSTPRVASEGFDLYIRMPDGEWRYAASAAPARRGQSCVLVTDMETTEKECLLYLPNYSELLDLKIGIDETAQIVASENPFRHKIVVFGSSFTHGVSTSRAGMSYPMQIERSSGLYFCNIACSGNCKLQSYFADYLADCSDADAMLFDAFSNPSAAMIEERLLPFIERIRRDLPDVPLIFVQTIWRERNNFNLQARDFERRKCEMARRKMAEAMARFDKVYFIDRDDLTGTDHATSADGTHPSDLGYWRWAQTLEPELLRILDGAGIR